MAVSALGATAIASGISAAGQAASNLISTGGSRRSQKRAFNMQQDLNNAQYQHDIDMWNAQNEYNTPASQMARYAEAGLNPALIYGSGSGSSGNSTSTPDYPHATAPTLEPYNPMKGQQEALTSTLAQLGQYQDVQNKKDTNNILKAQADQIRAQTWLLLQDQRERQGMEYIVRDKRTNESLQSHHDLEYARSRARLESRAADLDLPRYQLDNLKARTRQAGAAADASSLETYYRKNYGITSSDALWQRMLSRILNNFGVNLNF